MTALAAVAAGLASAAAAADPTDPTEIAHRMMDAMGGREAFESVRLLRFDFEVERDGERLALYRHWWDRQTGDYRIEGTERDGSPFRVLFDLTTGPTPSGVAWRGGERLEGDEASELLERAYQRHVNDGYWLLMPWKWLDPGVRLTYEGERTLAHDGDGGQTFDVVALEFADDVGLTPNDRYWGYVSQRTGLMERWEYLLQDEDGTSGEGEPTAWSWQDWQETDAGILLSTVKRRLGEGPQVTIAFPIAEARAEVGAEELSAIFGELHPEP